MPFPSTAESTFPQAVLPSCGQLWRRAPGPSCGATSGGVRHRKRPAAAGKRRRALASMSCKGPSCDRSCDTSGRSDVLSDPSGSVTEPLRRVAPSCRSSSLSDPAPPKECVGDFYALGSGAGKGFRHNFPRLFSARRVVHRTGPISTGIPTAGTHRWIFLWIHTAGRSRSPEAASNAAATSSSRRSLPCGPTSWSPTGSPSSVVPAGTEIAGQPVTVIRYAERIQSR